MSPNPFQPGTTREQIERAQRAHLSMRYQMTEAPGPEAAVHASAPSGQYAAPLERVAKRIVPIWGLVAAIGSCATACFSAGAWIESRKTGTILVALEKNTAEHAAVEARIRSLEMTLATVQGRIDIIAGTLGVMPTDRVLAIHRENKENPK